jgi:hypothetical protein
MGGGAWGSQVLVLHGWMDGCLVHGGTGHNDEMKEKMFLLLSSILPTYLWIYLGFSFSFLSYGLRFEFDNGRESGDERWKEMQDCSGFVTCV